MLHQVVLPVRDNYNDIYQIIYSNLDDCEAECEASNAECSMKNYDSLEECAYFGGCDLCNQIIDEVKIIQLNAEIISKIDIFSSLANLAMHNKYVRPILDEKFGLEIRNGRHPVVEKLISNDYEFIGNHIILDDKQFLSIITLIPVFGIMALIYTVISISHNENIDKLNNSMDSISSIEKIKETAEREITALRVFLSDNIAANADTEEISEIFE